jgi:hypothetical protein
MVDLVQIPYRGRPVRAGRPLTIHSSDFGAARLGASAALAAAVT